MENKLAMKPHAIMVAIPYQGHLSPFVHLAIKLASKGFAVTFVHFEYAHHRISKSRAATSSDRADIFAEARGSGLDIRYTTIPDGFPVDFDRNLNFEEYWDSILSDFTSRIDEFVGRVIESSDPSMFNCLVSDTIWSWSGVIANKYKLVNVSFWTQPAVTFAINYHLDLVRENGHYPIQDNHEHTINYVPGVESISTKDMMSYFHKPDTTTIHQRIMFKAFEEVKKADFVLHNTVQELESHALSALNRKHPTYAIGPVTFSTPLFANVSKSMLSETDCTEWLDSKPPGSVLYVSFGSLVQTNKQVIENIAQGLILSGVNFIWTIRSPQVANSVDSTHVLPIGFEDRVRDRGLIVPWCDQTAVLSHRAVGGFLTHCGWNSIVESIWCGIPLICYPVMFDQPTNRKLVVDDWKIGINLHDGEPINGKKVALKIKSLMSGETSDSTRNEMKRFRSILHNALDEDGSSERNLDRFVMDFKNKMKAIKEDVA